MWWHQRGPTAQRDSPAHDFSVCATAKNGFETTGKNCSIHILIHKRERTLISRAVIECCVQWRLGIIAHQLEIRRQTPGHLIHFKVDKLNWFFTKDPWNHLNKNQGTIIFTTWMLAWNLAASLGDIDRKKIFIAHVSQQPWGCKVANWLKSLRIGCF